MKRTVLALTLAVMLSGLVAATPAFAQFQSGGVQKEGTWHAGEGLKQGDYFSYSMCHIDYKECAEFEMDLWIKGDITVGSETKWLAEVVVYDGNKIVVGEMELGKIAPEPTGGSDELGVYRGAFKSSVVWLSAFATADAGAGGEGPKEFAATSWGKIGNIGGEQVLPTAIETVTVPAGTWETVQVSWKTGGARSQVWIVDEFPFPIKAKTFTHVSEGIPPTEYEFSLINYRENVESSPFTDVVPTADEFAAHGCQTEFDKDVAIKRPTKNFQYQIHIFYGPENPVQGCEMQWLIKFISVYDETEFLNQVQFDFLAVDDENKPIRSLAQDQGRLFLYSPSGQYILDMIVQEDPGDARYAVLVYGLAPEGIVPSDADDVLYVTVPVSPPKSDSSMVQLVPDWIKQSVGFWVSGEVDDDTFIRGMQFLINEGIIQVPSAEQGQGEGTGGIPDWIKTSVGFWVSGDVDDGTFIQSMQFLIKEGIISIS